MARTQATDYHSKRKAIRRQATKMFAQEGYNRTSMATLAGACAISKALLYHYYRDKDALLYDIISTHLSQLCKSVKKADQTHLEPKQRLLSLISRLLDAYSDADDEHRVQINALRYLDAEKQETLRSMERELVDLFSHAILAVHPKLGDKQHLLKPITMSLFGMLNWHYMWFRPDGKMTRQDYAEMALNIICDGCRNVC